MFAVMRYSPYSQEISEIVQAGRLGRLINLVQVEPVGYYHFAHSYVRGNWAKEDKSSFSLMTKSCQCVFTSTQTRDALNDIMIVISTSFATGSPRQPRLVYHRLDHYSTLEDLPNP